jgi:hypothetical protein
MDISDTEIEDYTLAYCKDLFLKKDWEELTCENLFVVYLSLLRSKILTTSEDEREVYQRCMDYVKRVRIERR